MNLLPLSNDLCDSLRALSVKKRQGVLEVVAPQREYELTFLEGRIVHADRLDNPLCDYLFDCLPEDERGFVDRDRLKDANKGDLITRLIESTRLTAKDLISYKHEYDRQTLNLLAAERTVSFDFRTKIIRCPEGLSLDLSPGHFMLDLIEANETSTAPQQADSPKLAKVVENDAPPAAIRAAPVADRPVLERPAPAVVPAKRPAVRRRRKLKRPPRLGRWSNYSQSSGYRIKTRQLSVPSNQMFLGVKLLLFLSLVILAPPFLNDWVSTLITFSFPQ